MPNKIYAYEWLDLAAKNLETADLLFKENHYTDVTGIEIQQALEKTFKAVQAYQGISIDRTHDLVRLYDKVKEFVSITIKNSELLEIITDYYISNRYPGPQYSMPSLKEIEKALELAHGIYLAVKGNMK
jgi:HEPN domain-containing protein